MRLDATGGAADLRDVWGKSNPPAPSDADAWWYAEIDLLEEIACNPSLDFGIVPRETEREAKDMARLTTATRKRMPKAEFGLPGKRAYPMPDRSHAANAKARASQAVNAGRMSKGTEAKIDEKANKVLGKGKKK